MHRILSFAFIVLLFGLLSCNPQEINQLDITLGRDYFPLDENRYWIYQVNHVDHNELADDIYESYQIKEVITQLIDSLGSEVRVERYQRQDSSDEWVIDLVFLVRKTSDHAVRVEQNVPYIKLDFPTVLSASWDANLLNSKVENEVFVVSVDQPLQLADGFYPESMMIQLEADTGNLLFRDWEIEYYAKDVGLVYKLIEDYQFVDQSVIIENGQEKPNPAFGIDSVISGYSLEWTLLESGLE